ncbi:MAG: 2-oxoacid:acceptor oxidoreductase subunit alpha, partial [Bdellovibrionales bacterium]
MESNNCNMRIATVNGTGSQSANNILIKTLFRMGVPVAGKNLFPSNIYGLPTWFNIRANKQGFTSFTEKYDIFVAMNNDTVGEDIRSLSSGCIFIYNESLKFDRILLREDTINLALPVKELTAQVTTSIKLKKLIANMLYVGVIAKLTQLDMETLKGCVADNFKNKDSVIEINLAAVMAGFEFAENNFQGIKAPIFNKSNRPEHEILIDGNTAGALGSVFGGCSFGAWYPITPSSSLMEAFDKYSKKFKKNSDGSFNFALVQAEDELASIGMVIGAGWSGARAMTATSGPGMSLMSEFVGLSYFAEIPAVIWDIQRVGPSTGLPTRTMQCDLSIAHTMGHGDSRHPVLIPENPSECYEFASIALNLAEELQTYVCVLSDLDIGMNLWQSEEFTQLPEIKRGKVLTAEDLKKVDSFARYRDVDGDGIPYRTLPGTHDPKAAYFTRGTGHDESSKYTESPEVFEKLMERLVRKLETAREMVPQPEIHHSDATIGLIYYASSSQIIPERENQKKKKGVKMAKLRIRALPLSRPV